MLTYMRAAASAAGLGFLLAGCTGGQVGVEPPTQLADVQNGAALTFAVGTARYAGLGTYLNTVTTFRQADGLSATLYNIPAIQGPPGFTVPNAASAGVDANTSAITATPPTQPGTTAVVTTFGQTGGAYAYGFAPINSSSTGAPKYPQFSAATAGNSALYLDAVSSIVAGSGGGNVQANLLGGGGAFLNTYTQPLYLSARNRLPFVFGPPATPNFHDGTFPPGFLGYPSGFTMFAATPVAGTYALTVTVPGNSPGSAPVAVKTASGTLSNVAPLAPVTAPVVASLGGGSASFTVGPSPPGVSKRVIYVVVVDGANGSPTAYSIDATSAGTYGITTANGPVNASGQHTPPFSGANGDTIFAYTVGADYDFLAPAPPANLQQTPGFPAQADITVSTVQEVVYSNTVGPLTTRRTAR
ncbi:MAG TPA: hypothetical protein VGU66_09900 [Candidatus Elarobacter sp.]|nr:hypothetical protein [Candidatus Elarobacter sp.]